MALLASRERYDSSRHRIVWLSFDVSLIAKESPSVLSRIAARISDLAYNPSPDVGSLGSCCVMQ